jgi:putrescine aminotransferase
MGALLKSGLQALGQKHNRWISEVRGKGLMIGIEFSEDEVGELVVAQLLNHGVCVAYALNNPRVMRFEPPLIISAEQIQFALEAFDQAMVETDALLASLV